MNSSCREKEILKKYEKTIIVDVTESPIERPKRKQKDYFSGKKGFHTVKTEIRVELLNLMILQTVCGKGREHDFNIHRKKLINGDFEILADKGYQGISGLYKKARSPHKKPKGRLLTKEQKRLNRELSRDRIRVEHVIRRLKIFKILSLRYRNRRKRFHLRFNLISAIYNFELLSRIT